MLALLVAFFATGCNETLEETYDEYTEGGMIRYVGKCSDVTVNPGWERLQVIWKNNIDAGVKRVKITWQSENEETPFVRYLEPSNFDIEDLMDTTYLEGLTDAVYTVRVSNVAADSTESLVEEQYGRPYTENHEDLRTFTRGISAFGKMGNKLALLLDQENPSVEELVLVYHEVGKAEECTWDIKEHITDTLYYAVWGMPTPLARDYIYLLPEEEGVQIDFNRPISVKRVGRLEGCIDEIDFKNDTLNLNERLWSTEFTSLMVKTLGSDWESKVDNITELELDYNLSTMQDLMYLPNLEKVILGKNRYMQSKYVNAYASTTDQQIGLTILSFLHETHPNFNVERYNNHYFGVIENDWSGTTWLDALKSAGKISDDFTITELAGENLDNEPQYQPLDTTNWEVTCTNSGEPADTIHNNYEQNGAAWLLYDDLYRGTDDWGFPYETEVYFEPQQTLGASIIRVTFDMQEPQVVAGFKVAQPARDEEGDSDYLISSLTIEFSSDGANWTAANYTEGNVDIGNSPGEVTFIPVPKSLQQPVQYVRITMSNKSVNTVSGLGIYNLRLGKFIPLKELSVTIP